MDSSRLASLAFVLTCAALAHGCAPKQVPPERGSDEDTLSSRDAVTSAQVVSRAQRWVDAGMPYCGGVQGGHDLICGGTCWRDAANPEWDAYRSDCSGLVSYAWGLPAPGRTTRDFAPYDEEVSRVIPASDLMPGDALNAEDDGGHIVLFAGWADPSAGLARIIEEYSCGKVAIEHALTLGTDDGSSVYLLDWSSHRYAAIRYKKLEPGSSTVGVSPHGCGDVTYAGYCTGDRLTWCQDGQLVYHDCEYRCGYEDASIGFNCLPAGSATGGGGAGGAGGTAGAGGTGATGTGGDESSTGGSLGSAGAPPAGGADKDPSGLTKISSDSPVYRASAEGSLGDDAQDGGCSVGTRRGGDPICIAWITVAIAVLTRRRRRAPLQRAKIF